MTNDDLIRSWKDPINRAAYGAGLPHPAGDLDLETARLAGGVEQEPVNGTQHLSTIGCCGGYTSEVRCAISALYPIPMCLALTLL
jgi:hypothetical protein